MSMRESHLTEYGRIKKLSLVTQMAKNSPAMQETLVRSLGQEDPLEEAMATHSSIFAWRIPWMEKPGGLQSWGRKESDMTKHAKKQLHEFRKMSRDNGEYQVFHSLSPLKQKFYCLPGSIGSRKSTKVKKLGVE